jgi:hypothetical protein
MNEQDKFKKTVKEVHRILMTVLVFVGVVTCLMIYIVIDPGLSLFKTKEQSDYAVVEEIVDEDLIVDGIHVRTGLIEAEGLMEVVNNCTNCHSAKLVTQNRMNKERWQSTIDWMQATQNLWELGGNEEIIINYLVTNYPPQKIGRRATLTGVEWYELKK